MVIGKETGLRGLHQNCGLVAAGCTTLSLRSLQNKLGGSGKELLPVDSKRHALIRNWNGRILPLNLAGF